MSHTKMLIFTVAIQFYNNSIKTYKIPTNDGKKGQVLKTNGKGELTWQDDININNIIQLSINEFKKSNHDNINNQNESDLKIIIYL